MVLGRAWPGSFRSLSQASHLFLDPQAPALQVPALQAGGHVKRNAEDAIGSAPGSRNEHAVPAADAPGGGECQADRDEGQACE